MSTLKKLEIKYVVMALLVIMSCIAYRHLATTGFITFDDNDYVTQNFVVQKGLTLEGLKYAFAFKDIAYWHPLTWMSMMLDFQLFGLNPAGYHLENLFWHVINVLLLYSILLKVTDKQWQSAAVAFLFALHPMNVEAVAWLVERKTVMSGTFFFGTIFFYIRYTEQRTLARYMPILIAMALGLMVKSMLTTLPVLLLLLDIWPLGRTSGNKNGRTTSQLIMEKIPMLALSAGSVYISMLSVGKRTVSHDIYPLNLRLENALVSTASYIGKLFWPSKLIVYYPLKASFPTWQVIAAASLLIVVSILSISLVKKYSWFSVGWLWFLVSLLPVSGLVQAGLWPSMADRFAYTPYIGLYIIIAWGLGALLESLLKQEQMPYLFAVAGLVVIVLIVRTSIQTSYWKDTVSLFEHAFAVVSQEGIRSPYPMPPAMINYLNKADTGRQLAEKGNLPEAIKQLSDVLADAPQDSNTHNNLAVAYEKSGEYSKALYHYNESLKYKQTALIHTNVGILLANTGKIDDAIAHFREALRIDPKFVDALINLGGMVAMKGKFEEGLQYLNQALEFDPKNAIAKKNIDAIKGALAEQQKQQKQQKQQQK